MAERKWAFITSGATFEALATTIVYFEDPKAALLGRRGKDGGQDARSGDGTRVFQAKHHESGSAASAIRDAKKEAAQIEGYRQPGHARHAQWQGVTHRRLVTNAAFNTTDKQKWDTEVVPQFTKQGLTPDYWERQTLEALLDKHPEIHRSFCYRCPVPHPRHGHASPLPSPLPSPGSNHTRSAGTDTRRARRASRSAGIRSPASSTSAVSRPP